ncbi:MAG: hypothetical protein IJO76_01865 [Clostridia bacterium]|nr:hypothetical protein [Clostridia bacterium]
MDWKELLVLCILAAVVLVAFRLTKNRGGHGRAAMLMKKYADLPWEKLAAAPREELVEAVVSHVLAQAENSRRPDVVMVLADKPHGFTVVYSVWAVCREMAAGSYAMLKHTATKHLTEQAEASFTAIGAAGTAAAWQALCADPSAEAEGAFHRAVESECPLSLCEAYILDNPEQFGGEPAEVTE